MLLTFDRTNFPLLAIEEVGVEIQLLPVTKQQFEQFLAESGAVEPAHYQEMLALQPIPPLDDPSLDQRERLFVTGILPNETKAYSRWLGEGFDLPTVKEWRAVYRVLKRTSLPRHHLATELGDSPAAPILARLIQQLPSHLLLDICLMRGGLVEWVKQGRSWLGLGEPRPHFHPNLWDPLTHEIKPLRPQERLPYFGFRLIRRGEWYLAERDKVRYVE
jgi:hypothetical protein